MQCMQKSVNSMKFQKEIQFFASLKSFSSKVAFPKLFGPKAFEFNVPDDLQTISPVRKIIATNLLALCSSKFIFVIATRIEVFCVFCNFQGRCNVMNSKD